MTRESTGSDVKPPALFPAKSTVEPGEPSAINSHLTARIGFLTCGCKRDCFALPWTKPSGLAWLSDSHAEVLANEVTPHRSQWRDRGRFSRPSLLVLSDARVVPTGPSLVKQSPVCQAVPKSHEISANTAANLSTAAMEDWVPLENALSLFTHPDIARD